MSTTVVQGIETGKLGGCLWLYSNYHCNMACKYCLTESSPNADRRLLGRERMMALTREAASLGFTSVGVGGGEPFMLPEMPELLIEMAGILPLVVLTNGTLFSERMLERLRPLADLPVSMQVSLDSADPEVNDRNREPGNHAKVVEAIRRLKELGIKVRLATTGAPDDDEARAALCTLHRDLGIDEEDHIVRPIVKRGRAVDDGDAMAGTTDSLPPELTTYNERDNPGTRAGPTILSVRISPSSTTKSPSQNSMPSRCSSSARSATATAPRPSSAPGRFRRPSATGSPSSRPWATPSSSASSWRSTAAA